MPRFRDRKRGIFMDLGFEIKASGCIDLSKICYL